MCCIIDGMRRRKAKAVGASQHWARALEVHLSGCGAALAAALIASTPWQGAQEDLYAPWLEDPLLRGGYTAAVTPTADTASSDVTASTTTATTAVIVVSAEDALLSGLPDREPGSLCDTLCTCMRKVVREDQGSIEVRCYWSTCCLCTAARCHPSA
jgi:hypothetical protein